MAIETTDEQLAALKTLPQDAPVVMVNLLKFRENGGLESYQRYGQEVAPLLKRAGATVRYGGATPAVIIGDGAAPWWDVILLVEYPTPGAFLAMVTDPAYAEVHQHRANALERGDLVATTMWSIAPG